MAQKIKTKKREIEISNHKKEMFPDDHITKLDMAEYYKKIADHMLPYIEDRPLMMQRFPNGIEENGFYNKEMPGHFPDWIKGIKVKVKRESKEKQRFVNARNVDTLIYLANQAVISMHTWPSKKNRPEKPDKMIYDLDPPGNDFSDVRQAALDLKELLN